jgi:hypothetical protein
MLVLLLVTLASVVAGLVLMFEMIRRRENFLGLSGLTVLLAAGILAAVYAAQDSA